MQSIFVTVSDGDFFPGTVATVNSVLRYHPEARICVVNNDVQQESLSREQRDVFVSAGVRVLDARNFEKPGRKLAAWELKAYAAADLPGEEAVLVGIDSDCVLCGPIDDVISEAMSTGKFLGGHDDTTNYDEDYRVYGIETPVRNEQYMSTSLYVCSLTEANREVLQAWAQCCDRAVFGGSDIYPGHGDQGVLNAVLYARRGREGVRVLQNTLWSQHHCYWQHALELREGRIFNSVAQSFQRSLHCGGTEKFWSKDHLKRLSSHEKHVLNYAWFQAHLWFGLCAVGKDHLNDGHSHLSDSLDTYRQQIEAILPAATGRAGPI